MEHSAEAVRDRGHRRIIGPKRVKETGEWRRLCKEELYDLYSSPSISRVFKSKTMGWAGHEARTKDRRSAYTISVEKSEEKRSLTRPLA